MNKAKLQTDKLNNNEQEETAALKAAGEVLPVIPLRGVLVFPNSIVHLDVGRERSIAALDEAMLGEKKVFLCMQKDALTDEPNFEEVYLIGTIATVKQVLKLPGGTVRLVVDGESRGRLLEPLQTEPYMQATVKQLSDNFYECDETEMEALCRLVRSSFHEFAGLNKKVASEVGVAVDETREPGELADIIANAIGLQLEEKQQILATVDVEERLNALLLMVANEVEVREVERRISERVRQQMEKNQKEYYLREQIRAIQKELGEGEDKDAIVAEIKEKMVGRQLPDYVEEKINKELRRLNNMPAQMAEANVVQNYVEWLLDLPWDIETTDRLDLKAAEDILRADHYGIEKVKERVLEHLAVRQMSDNPKGSILCFVGPPGVGKTSLARSIANALERKYVRVSFGGVRDESEIRGHRRTYIGSMPGRIIQSMKTAGSKNPLFLLDEIDKLANDFRGDPASALLEVLDPEQNNTFSDHYIEIPFDLSKVLFITTANVESDIPRPLLDRMEVIHLSGYTDEEKLQIALRHLVPKQFHEHGLTEKQLTLSQGALLAIIHNYTREAGVRNLEREIAKICRKVDRQIVSGDTHIVKVTAQNVGKYLGLPRFHHDGIDVADAVGMVTGLAWTEAGGEVLTVEALKIPGKGKLTLTGQLGDVMKESAYAAWTYLRSLGDAYGVTADVDEHFDIHIHVPEGAIPKDGPSAGVTMVTALASLFSERKVRHDVAMTGEVTLRGRVLPIGGLKEKALAAYRAGCKTIIIPKDNAKDLEEIPANIRSKIEFVLAERVEDVLEVALLPPTTAPKKPSKKQVSSK